MLSKLEYPGLCGACLHSLTCSVKCASGGPILFCEKFNHFPIMEYNTDPQTVYEPVNMTEPVTTASIDSKDVTSPKLSRGLCQTCRSKTGCVRSEYEQNVWFCEKYI